MPAGLRWALSEEQLKARGVDVVLLRQGVHLQLAGNGVSLQVMFSLSQLGVYDDLGFWYAQLEGVDRGSVTENRGNVKRFIDSLKESVREAQLKKDPKLIQHVLDGPVLFPSKQLNPVAAVVGVAAAVMNVAVSFGHYCVQLHCCSCVKCDNNVVLYKEFAWPQHYRRKTWPWSICTRVRLSKRLCHGTQLVD
jgi:hypothetical protein